MRICYHRVHAFNQANVKCSGQDYHAPMENCCGTLKTESLHRYCFSTREQANQAVFEYIGQIHLSDVHRRAVNTQRPTVLSPTSAAYG